MSETDLKTVDDFDHHTAQIGETQLHYVTSGSGFPVVLLHGWPQTWYCWRKVMKILREKFFVIAPDLRGLGDSTDPQNGYDKASIASDIHHLMRDVLRRKEYHLVGHDWGGAVAWAMAAHYPGGAKSLTVVDVAIPGDGQQNISQGGRRWHHAFHQSDLPEALVRGREDIYLNWFYDNYGLTAEAISQEDRSEYLRTYSRPENLHAGFEYYRALATDIAANSARAKEYTPAIPVLAVGGSGEWGRGNEVAASLRRMTTNVEERVIDGAGHWVPEEQPEVLASHLLEFFERSNPALHKYA